MMLLCGGDSEESERINRSRSLSSPAPLLIKAGVLVTPTQAAREVVEDVEPGKDQVTIHGLEVQRYREVYHSVLTPAALKALDTSNPEYMAEVLELKQRLWVALKQPQLQESVGEDGRVHVTETFNRS